jgi:hypothetical protein
MKEKIIETARKVLALAERGSPGEKDAAAAMLERMILKHNLKMEQIRVLAKQYKFNFANRFERKIIVQTIASFDLPVYHLVSDSKKYVYTDCDEVTFHEVSAKINFYLKAWRDKVDIFLDAFVEQNQLWRPSKDADADCEYVITDEMLAKYKKQMAMQQSMQPDVFYKTISKKAK